ncbi:MAG TPA: OmpA family protein [Chroococcales cyanobacterium]
MSKFVNSTFVSALAMTWLCALVAPPLPASAQSQRQSEAPDERPRAPRGFNTLPPNYTSPEKSTQQPVDPDLVIPEGRSANSAVGVPSKSSASLTMKRSAVYSGPTGLKAIAEAKDECSRKLTISTDALFESDRSTLIHEAKETLNALCSLLSTESNHPIKIEGHSDKSGNEKNNLELSEKRAQRVKNWLLQNHAAKPAQVTVAGYGSRVPATTSAKKDNTDSFTAQAADRRIEVTVDTCRTVTNDAGTSSAPPSTVPAPAAP